MFRKLLFIIFLLHTIPALAAPPPFCYQEEDGTPSGCFKKIKFVNGSLTDNLDGSYSHDQAGLGGAETNSLEVLTTGIATTEIPIGTGVNTVVYAPLSGDVTMTNGGVVTISADKILESMLKAVDTAVDEECLTYESTTGDFEWQACGSGGGAFTDGGSTVYITTSYATDNVGLGTNSADARLEIAVNGTTPFMISQAASGNGDLFIVKTTGNVGIGSVNPKSVLDVIGAITASGAISGSNLSGTNTGDNTVATSGDSATSFFASGEIADAQVADNITITNISQVGDITATASEINTPLDGALVTLDEFRELETIGATVISAADWTAVSVLVGTNTGDNDEVGTKTTGDLCVNDGSSVNCTVNLESELETALDGINVLVETEIDSGAELLALYDDEVGTGFPVFNASPNFTGNIGMGTTVSLAVLEINELGTVPFMISNGAAGDGDLFIVTSAGNVGIGTAIPGAIFSVKGTDGIILPKQTADPCTAAKEGMVFYNDTSNYMCYCDGTNDLKMNDNTTACF